MAHLFTATIFIGLTLGILGAFALAPSPTKNKIKNFIQSVDK